MSRKLFPVFLMLLAGAVTWLITFFSGYELKKMLIILLVVLLVFYIMGALISRVMETFVKKEEKPVADEGEVIEKEKDASAGDTATEKNSSEAKKETGKETGKDTNKDANRDASKETKEQKEAHEKTEAKAIQEIIEGQTKISE